MKACKYSSGLRLSKLALVVFMTITFLVYTSTPGSATSIPVQSMNQPQQQGDWFMVFVAIVGAVAAVAGVIVAIVNSPATPPAAESMVRAQADEKQEGEINSTNRLNAPAEAIAFASRNKGSRAFADLTMTNQGKGA
jgi:hypothetical protein